MKQSWKKYLGWLISPTAVGIYITLILIRLTFSYYEIAAHGSGTGEEQGVAGWVYTFHQKSIDFRLRRRGPRQVSPNLALLTVDERAVETVGRWPWPRELIAKALDNAYKNGAKLVVFDMIFSEPSLNPAQRVLDQMRTEGVTNGEATNLLNSYKQRMDSDKALADSFTKYAPKIVAGSFFNGGHYTHWAPETDFCRDMIFKRMPEAKLWDHEEVLLSVSDPYQPYMPNALTQVFSSVLQEKENAVKAHFGTPKNRNDEVRLEGEIHDALHETCNTILEDFREGLSDQWKEAVLSTENPKEFTFPTYDAWLADYRQKSRPNGLYYTDQWTLNTPEVSSGIKNTGYFNTLQDADGTIRSKVLVVRSGNSYFPSISLKAYLVANNYNAAPKLEYTEAAGQKEIADIEVTNNDTGDVVGHIPTDRQGKLLVNYAGPAGMFPYMSFADLLTDSPTADIEQIVFEPTSKRWVQKIRKVNKAEFLKDKIFIAGATATGIYDLRVTPFQENFPGTETHLNALDNMIQGNYFHNLENEAIKMPVFLAIVGLILSIALSYLGAVSCLALVSSLLVGIFFYDQYFLFSKGIVVSIIWPFVLIFALYITLTFFRYFTEERNKKELRQTFQKYVSPAIVEEILAHPDNIQLGGRKANLTVFFSDVRGFTTISEKLDPAALSDLLNSYLTPMTEIVFKNRGTLDKYMGDAVMAFFGAPIGYNDHAHWACRCALESLEKLYLLQKEYEAKGLPTIDIGIGLNTGDVNVGNMGSETVRSYTVMGDAVNLASRLEGINKQYGTRIILSEFTYAAVKENFVCREVDRVRVKGKLQPIKIYELIAENKAKAPPSEHLKIFQQGYEYYHAMNWSAGMDAFSKALDLKPDDEVSKLYIERCQDYINEPPETGWDGVFVMKTK